MAVNVDIICWHRERDSSPAGMSRKRPSMLSEFQGKHVYGDRDRSRSVQCVVCLCLLHMFP